MMDQVNTSDQVKCPKCGSTQITPVTLRNKQILITCLACGNQFKPGTKSIPPVKPADKKKLSLGCGVLIVIFIIVFSLTKTSDKKGETANASPAKIINKDSLINVIKHDDVYKVTKVEILPDSTMRIAVKDPENFGTDDYFIKNYHLLETGVIEEVEISKGNKILFSSGHHTDKIIEAFKEINMVGDKCFTFNQAIEQSLNDPNSFEAVKSSYSYLGNNMFEVVSQFRAKNAFNATITREAKAIMTTNGMIIKWAFL